MEAQGSEQHRFHKFDPARAERLLSEERASALPPEDVLALLDAQPGHVAADVGCGPGFFALPLARRVRPGGRVLALDIVPEMLARLRDRLAAEGVENVEPILSEEARLPLPPESCDRALLVNLLHELANPAALLAEVARVLRPGGRGVAVDWAPRPSPMGPPLDVRVAPTRAGEWLRIAGLTPEPAGDLGLYSYAIVFRR